MWPQDIPIHSYSLVSWLPPNTCAGTTAPGPYGDLDQWTGPNSRLKIPSVLCFPWLFITWICSLISFSTWYYKQLCHHYEAGEELPVAEGRKGSSSNWCCCQRWLYHLAMASVPWNGLMNTSFCWWTVRTQPGSSSSQLMRWDSRRRKCGGRGGGDCCPQHCPKSNAKRNQSLQFTFSACFRSDSYRSCSCRLMVALSIPMGREAWVETSTKLKLFFWWVATEGLGDLCLCACFACSVMPFCFNTNSALEGIWLFCLTCAEDGHKTFSSGIPLIQRLLCQTLKQVNLICWHTQSAHAKFSVFKAAILQVMYCSGSARLLL